MQPDRLVQIRHYLYTHGSTGIHELAQAMDISLATIRRDLQRLEEEGIITRSHGGAAIADSSGTELAFSVREKRGIDVKRAIANAAFERLMPRTAVFFDAGTTVLQLAKRLRLTPLPLTLFTNSLAVAEVLFGIETIQLVMLGGRLRNENKCLVGPIAEQTLEGLWFDQLYLGTSAIQPDNNFGTPDDEEARLNRIMLKHSTDHLLLAESSKFGRHATYRVAPLGDISHVFTDARLTDEWQTRLRQIGVPFSMAEAVPDEL